MNGVGSAFSWAEVKASVALTEHPPSPDLRPLFSPYARLAPWHLANAVEKLVVLVNRQPGQTETPIDTTSLRVSARLG